MKQFLYITLFSPLIFASFSNCGRFSISPSQSEFESSSFKLHLENPTLSSGTHPLYPYRNYVNPFPNMVLPLRQNWVLISTRNIVVWKNETGVRIPKKGYNYPQKVWTKDHRLVTPDISTVVEGSTLPDQWNPRNEITLTGCKGESESFQIVVSNKNSFPIRVQNHKVFDLISIKNNENKITTDNISVRHVGYVQPYDDGAPVNSLQDNTIGV